MVLLKESERKNFGVKDRSSEYLEIIDSEKKKNTIWKTRNLFQEWFTVKKLKNVPGRNLRPTILLQSR